MMIKPLLFGMSFTILVGLLSWASYSVKNNIDIPLERSLSKLVPKQMDKLHFALVDWSDSGRVAKRLETVVVESRQNLVEGSTLNCDARSDKVEISH
jgi:hypothetical protein